VKLDLASVVPAAQLRGEDAEDTAQLKAMLAEAGRFLRGFRWAGDIESSYFGLGVGKVAFSRSGRPSPA
jgi:hypothetical protein